MRTIPDPLSAGLMIRLGLSLSLLMADRFSGEILCFKVNKHGNLLILTWLFDIKASSVGGPLGSQEDFGRNFVGVKVSEAGLGSKLGAASWSNKEARRRDQWNLSTEVMVFPMSNALGVGQKVRPMRRRDSSMGVRSTLQRLIMPSLLTILEAFPV